MKSKRSSLITPPPVRLVRRVASCRVRVCVCALFDVVCCEPRSTLRAQFATHRFVVRLFVGPACNALFRRPDVLCTLIPDAASVMATRETITNVERRERYTYIKDVDD